MIIHTKKMTIFKVKDERELVKNFFEVCEAAYKSFKQKFNLSDEQVKKLMRESVELAFCETEEEAREYIAQKKGQEEKTHE